MYALLALLQVSAYFISLILAGYLLSRSRFHPVSIATAGLLVSYALIQTDQFLGRNFEGDSAWLGRLLWLAYPLPVALIARMAILLRPDGELDITLDRVWWTLLLPVTMMLILGGWLGEDLVDFTTRERGELYPVYAIYNVVVTVGAVLLFYRNLRQSSPTDTMHRLYWWLYLGSMAYLGSMVLLLTGLIPAEWVFVLVLTDILMLGFGGILYEAISEGQAIQNDLLMTFIKGGSITIVVVMPWAVALMISNVQTLALAMALFFSQGVIAIGISLQDDWEGVLERAFFRQINPQREQLRALLVTTARKPITQTTTTPELDREEFIRLTRRALSHIPNLPRLAASPLTEMQVVTQRVEPNANTLERANELRAVLVECIEALRPQNRGEYGITDEWRFFNALYYPYVVGVSPYKRTHLGKNSNPEMEIITKWFQQEVPPRTLYNWQNRGAEMIAGILLEQESHSGRHKAQAG